MTPRWTLLPLLLAAIDLPARVGVVDTFTRERFEGHVRFETNVVVVANADEGLLVRVSLTNLAGLFFRPESATDSATSALAGPRAAAEALPAGWSVARIGDAASGETITTNGLFRLRCGGSGIGSASDSFQFLCKPVRGETEIVARILLLEHGGRNAAAGLMVRQGLDADSPGALLALTPMRGGRLVARPETGDVASEETLAGWRPPCWLRLRRAGRAVSGWCSRDGRRWRTVGQFNLPLREEVFVGVAVCAGRIDRLMRVTLDQLREGPSLPFTGFVPLVELQGGSVVHGPLAAADETEMHFPDPLTRGPLSTRFVANIRFQWVPDRWTTRLTAGKPGLLLRDGEFVEGDFVELDGHEVVVSSVLMGLRRFDVNRDLLAAVLRPPRRAPMRFEVRDTDGSVWRSTEVALADNEVLLHEPVLGVRRIPIFALAELRRH